MSDLIRKATLQELKRNRQDVYPKDTSQNLSGEKPERNVARITFRVLGSILGILNNLKGQLAAKKQEVSKLKEKVSKGGY